MNADFSAVQTVLIDLRSDKYCNCVLQSKVYEHYSLEKYDLAEV
jgi:hypothetical protein